jgi:hypothetical protein
MADNEKKDAFTIQLEKLIEEWERDADLDHDATNGIRNIPKLHGKYYTRLLHLRKKLMDEREKLEDAEFKQTLYYTGRADVEVYKSKPQNFIIPKNELPMWLKADEELKTIRRRITRLEEMQKAYTEIIDQINSRSWKFKTILESERFKAGLNS